MRYLMPMILRERYYASVEAEIMKVLHELIYQPLIDILSIKPYELENARLSLLSAAIRQGKIYYRDGYFSGEFTAVLSKELRKIGARYSLRHKSFYLPLSDLPPELSIAQSNANSHFEDIRRRMIETLNRINTNKVDEISRNKGNYEKTIHHMETDFQQTLPKEETESALKKITIEWKLSPSQIERVASEWGENLNIYIKGWATDNILKLREEIQSHALQGGRAQGLVKSIQDNYGVAQRKAKFLARQETALLMSKFQETRYADIGISKYRWSDSHDQRVRHDHHDLNGKIFSFSNPPITNRKTGARNNPGQDYNCRCIAIPVVE